MKKAFLFAAWLTVFLSMPFGVAHAGWQSDITQNQIAATSYINALRAGGSPQRPGMISGGGWQSENARAEINAAMNDAEYLAKRGRYDLIETPRFSFNISERQEIKREVRKQMSAQGYRGY